MGGKKNKDKSKGQGQAEPVKPPVSVETLVAGDAKSKAKTGDAVTVHYVGTLASDGSEFDSSRAKKSPFTFKLGGGSVIKGWDLGVAQMCLNQRAKLFISAQAGYGAAGCVDKEKASGTGVIPPDADLIFDVELLDINFAVTLSRYRETLDAWLSGKLAAFDGDEEARKPLEATHGSRSGYETYLKGVAAKKYQAERTKRFASAGIDASKVPDSKEAVEKGLGSSKKTAPPSPPSQLQFDARFAMFKVEANDEEEIKQQVEGVAPRNLHNAAELFVHLGHHKSAATLHICVAAALETLEAGPDGKTAQRLGRACVCWACGHVGLPTNAAQCSERGPTPKGVCAGCGDDSQSNFVRCVTSDGKVLPWIERGPALTPEQTKKAEEATNVAKTVEVS